MKYALTIISIVTFFSITLPTVTVAKRLWWDTGVGLLNSLGSAENSETTSELTANEIGEAFKQALAIGTKNVVGQLGSTDVKTFILDQRILPLPTFNLKRHRHLK